MDHNNFSGTTRADGITHYPQVQTGSIVVEIEPSVFQHYNQLGQILEDVARTHKPKFGTIGCLMYRQSENINTNDIWVVTVGHTFLLKYGPHRQIDRYCNENAVVSQICAPPKQMCHLADDYYAAMDYVDVNEEPKFVDLCIFPLNKLRKDVKLYSMEIPSVPDGMLDMFTGNAQYLMNRNVAKTGFVTGHTTGTVIASDIATKIDYIRSGLFAVVGTTQDTPFAKLGDSGSLVIDRDDGKVLGMISAVIMDNIEIEGIWYRNVTFCVRMDYCIRYAEQRWNTILSFNNPSQPCPPRPLSPARSFCDRVRDIAEELTRLGDEHTAVKDENDLLKLRLQSQHETNAYVSTLQDQIQRLRTLLRNEQRTVIRLNEELSRLQPRSRLENGNLDNPS